MIFRNRKMYFSLSVWLACVIALYMLEPHKRVYGVEPLNSNIKAAARPAGSKFYIQTGIIR